MTPRTLIALYKIANATPPLSSEQQEDAATVDQDKQPNTSDPQLKAAEQTSKPVAPTPEQLDANRQRAAQEDSDARRAMTDPMALYKHVAKAMKHSGRVAKYVLDKSGLNKNKG